MTLDTICWIIAGIVIWESLYILVVKNDYMSDYGWFGKKMFTLWLLAPIMGLHYIIVFGCNDCPFGLVAHYERLIYEVAIIGSLIIFFYLNKKLAEYITLKKSTAVDSLKGGIKTRK